MRTLLEPLMYIEEQILEGLHAIGLTWGLAIVALTLLVRITLLPLAVRSARVRRMRGEHSVQLKAIRDRHADDVVKQQDELAAYRRRHGLNPRGLLIGAVFQILVVISLALLLRGDSAQGQFGNASWLFIPDISEPVGGVALAWLLGAWVAIQVVSMRLAAQVSPRRLMIAVLAPIPLLFAASHMPAGILVYLLVSSAFGLALRLVLRSRGLGPVGAPVAA